MWTGDDKPNMRRKPTPAPEPIIANEILEQAKRSLLSSDKLTQPRAKCVVCGSDCAPNSSEGLCWVCRRLKISAWRDSDQQMTAQE